MSFMFKIIPAQWRSLRGAHELLDPLARLALPAGQLAEVRTLFIDGLLAHGR
jgi:hypothetical protein